MAHLTTTLSLRDHLDSETLLQVASAMPGSAIYREPRFIDGPDGAPDNDWSSLFEHQDPRGMGWGFFSLDAQERHSRRIDLRGPTDLDPGPLAMCEPQDSDAGIVLTFTLDSDGQGLSAATTMPVEAYVSTADPDR